MRGLSLLLVLLACLAGPAAQACPSCRPAVEAGVFDQDFAATFALLMSPLLVIALVGAVLYFAPPRPRGSGER